MPAPFTQQRKYMNIFYKSWRIINNITDFICNEFIKTSLNKQDTSQGHNFIETEGQSCTLPIQIT